ncbi:hypothetical protein [Streptomyces sp. NPDC003077]|uniref:hypothetical protein n=1 Tax=Streptomyces sp. NPDC003077 TaxID=3154443 RepID=UPI0033A524FD
MNQHVRKILFGLDIAGFNCPGRSDWTGLAMRRALYEALGQGLAKAGIQPDQYELLDRGDGVMVVLDPVAGADELFLTVVPTLAQAIGDHNVASPSDQCIRLRAVLHTGHVIRDEHGYVGQDVSLAFRLLNCAELRAALEGSRSDLVLVLSDAAQQSLDRTRCGDCALIRSVIRTKERAMLAWLAESTTRPVLAG